MKKRVMVGCFKQESNSFSPKLTDFDSFRRSYAEGDAFVHSDGKAGESVVGIVNTLEQNGIEAIGAAGMFSTSGGPIKHQVYTDYLRRFLEILHGMDRPDGIVLNLHGATLSDQSDDICGDLLEAIRADVGYEMPITVAFDLHANITPKILRNANAVCGYQTYPHVDLYGTGCRAAEMMVRILQGKQVQDAAAFVPMTASASGYTTNSGKLRKLIDHGHELAAHGDILDFSVFLVQPWLDISNMASCVNIIAGDAETARNAADLLSRELYDLRDDIQPKEIQSIEDVVKTAVQTPDGTTVILVDSADSAGAGSCSDSAAPLEAILAYRHTLRAALAVTDPAAVDKAFSLGIGAVADFEIGGKLAPVLSKPVFVKDALVKSLHDGVFIFQGPVDRGQKFSVGRSVVLQADEVLILVTSVSGTHRDMQIFRGFGIEPSTCKLLCVKANTSFKAGYSSLNSVVCECDTPGAACPVLQRLPYRNVPVPFYPFQEIDKTNVTPAKSYFSSI